MSENRNGTRVFVCVQPPREIVSGIGEFLRTLERFTSFRWVKADRVHVTLKFLGESEIGAIQAMDTNLSRIGGIGAFEAEIDTAGAFPSLSRPRVVWLGVGKGAEDMKRLASRVDRAAVNSGYDAEKRAFQPHLTLGRAKGDGSGDDVFKEALCAAPKLSWSCDAFTLMKSVLTPQGPIYTPIRSYRLG